MDRGNIEKIAQSPEDKVLLAKLWDKITAGMRKNIIASTCFLSPRELHLAKFLFGQQEGLYAFGGYPEAERQMLVYQTIFRRFAAVFCAEDCLAEKAEMPASASQLW